MKQCEEQGTKVIQSERFDNKHLKQDNYECVYGRWMKGLLLPLIVSLSLPLPVNAKTYWLILTYDVGGSGMEALEMENEEACEIQGKKWVNSSTHGKPKSTRRFHCLIGK